MSTATVSVTNAMTAAVSMAYDLAHILSAPAFGDAVFETV